LLAAALASMLLGLGMILCLPVDRQVRVAAVVVWSFVAGRESAVIWFSYKHFVWLRIFADGGVELRTTDRRRLSATIVRGSLVLARVAWLRLRLADGRCYLGLVRADVQQSKQWRRLQGIWRHLGTAG